MLAQQYLGNFDTHLPTAAESCHLPVEFLAFKAKPDQDLLNIHMYSLSAK